MFFSKVARYIKNNPHLAFAVVLLLANYIYNFQAIRYIDPWSDEAYTGILTDLGLKDYVVSVAVDSHPWLFPVVIKVWKLGFGNSMLALRSFAYLFGCLTVLLIAYATGAKSKYLSVLTTIFLIANPFFNAYLVEARPYTLYLFCFFLVCFSCKDQKFNIVRKWLPIFLLTHFFALVYFGVFFLNYLIAYKENLPNIRKAFAPALLLAIFFLMPLSLAHLWAGGGRGWIPNIREIPFTDFLAALFYGVESKIPGGMIIRGFKYVHSAYFSIAILSIFGWALLLKRKIDYLTASLILAPPLFFALLSLVFDINYLVPRYFLPSLILFYLVLIESIYVSLKKFGATLFVAVYLTSLINVTPLTTSTIVRSIANSYVNQPIAVLDSSLYINLRYYRGHHTDLFWLYGKSDTEYNVPYKHNIVSELPANTILLVDSEDTPVDLTSDSVLAQYDSYVVLQDLEGLIDN